VSDRDSDARCLFRLIPLWVERFVGEDRKTQEELARTVQAFGEWNLNVKSTAKRLKLHPNIVYFRLNRVREITDVDPRSFAGLTVILTVLRLLARQQRPFANSHKTVP
jgi:sugar diacid utilization regulator